MDDKQVVRCPSCGCELALLEFDGLGCCFSGKHAADCYTGFPKLFDTPETALSAAQKRWVEPNRVMTLEEVKAHISESLDVPSLFMDFPSPWDTEEAAEIFGIVHWRNGQRLSQSLHNDNDGYNVRWRCWMRKPTDEERAAPWEGERT